MAEPIVMVSSYPPRTDGASMSCEEAREFLRRMEPGRPVVVVSHQGAAGEGVLSVIDLDRPDWWQHAGEVIRDLSPHVVHLAYDAGLYDRDGERPEQEEAGFLALLKAVGGLPTLVELHTIPARLRESEAAFFGRLCALADVVVLKCHYQQWRLNWTLPNLGWPVPENIAIVPHGARPDRRYGVHEVPQLRRDLGLDGVPNLAEHLVGLIGWMPANRKWDLLTGMWEEIAAEIHQRTGQRWDLLAAGTPGEPGHSSSAIQAEVSLQRLQEKGLAHYYEFVPRDEQHYKMLGVCDFVVLPSIDESQSGTLAGIIALNKPFITAAPMEGLTAQTLESGGGLLFTNRAMLRQAVVQLACDEGLRLRLGEQLKLYLDQVVSWERIVRQYAELYALARRAKETNTRVRLATEG